MNAVLDRPLPTTTARDLPMSGVETALVAVLHVTLMSGVVIGWVRTVTNDRLDGQSTYGLAGQFGWAWWAACASVVVGFHVALLSKRPSRPLLVAYLGLAVLVLHATYPALTDVPYNPWTYKYIGVSRSIDTNGAVSRWADVYNNWPGALALGGAVSRLTGIDTMTLAHWCPPVFTSFQAVAAGALSRTFTRDPRVIYGSMFLFLISYWTYLNTWVPQPIAFVFVFVALAIAIERLSIPPAERRWLGKTLFSQRSQVSLASSGPAETMSMAMTVLGVLVFCAATVVSHQLSPFIAVAMFGALALFGTLRPWWIPVVIGAMTIGWFYVARDFLDAHPSFLEVGGSLFSNARGGTVDNNLELASSRNISLATLALCGVLWALGGIGALVMLRRKPRDWRPALVAFAPFGILAGGSYGGEGVYRVFLFSMPGVAFLIAAMLLGGRRRWWKALLAPALSMSVVVLLVFAQFGRTQLFLVTPADVELTQWFGDHASTGSTLVMVSLNTPDRFQSNYTDFGEPWLEPNLMKHPNFVHQPLDAAYLERVIGYLDSLDPAGDIYLVSSHAQWRLIENFGLLPGADAEQRFLALLDGSSRFERQYANSAGELYRFTRSG